MPRLIDHDDRNEEIAAAAFRVIERDGLAGLSVRRVADEAGIATASLRRAFPTQDALRRFCFDRIQEAVATRLLAIESTGMDRALQWMRELLPLDDVRRTELVVQLQLSRLALTDANLAENARQLHDGVRRVCAAVVRQLTEEGQVDERIDVDLEVARLHALLDGLALHLLWSPPADPAGHADRMLERHLRSLAA